MKTVIFRMIYRFLMVFWGLLSLSVYSQSNFELTYGDSLDNFAKKCILTYDGNYLIGCLDRDSLEYQTTRLMKVDTLGGVIWVKTFDLNNFEDIIQTQDSGFVILASKSWVIKLNKIDKNGDSLWYNQFSNNHFTLYGRALEEFSNGNIIVVGDAFNLISSRPPYRYWLITDSEGVPTYQDFFICGSLSDVVIDNNDYPIITGKISTYEGSAFCLLKLHPTGEICWVKEHWIQEYTQHNGISIDFTKDSGFIVTGSYDYYPYMIRYSKGGSIIWEDTIIDQQVPGRCVITTPDSGYLVTFIDQGDINISKYSDAGEIVYSRLLGGMNTDVASDLLSLSPDKLLIAGYSNSYSNGDYDIYLIKTDDWGIYTSLPDLDYIANDVSLYPNPVPRGSTIKIQHLNTRYTSYQLFNFMGKLLYSGINNDNSISLDPSIMSGIYILNFYSSNELLNSKKIVIF